jgi:hypothetical protein
MGLSAADRGSSDPLFDKAFIDVYDWRDEPVRHRFVHGGFEGTDARFAIYFDEYRPHATLVLRGDRAGRHSHSLGQTRYLTEGRSAEEVTRRPARGRRR